MTDPDETREQAAEGPEEEEEDFAETPFDNPYFLPVLFFLFAAWLFYDGFLNQDFIQKQIQEEDHFTLAFNRWGAGVTALLGAFFSVKAIRERRSDSD